MIDTLKFEIVQGHHAPRNVKRGEKERLEQDIYMHNGGAFPTRVVLSFDNAHECLPVGLYTLCPSSFRTNQYNSLELDRWNLKFLPLQEKQLSKVS